MRRRTFVVAGIAALTAGCSGSKDDAGPPVKVTLLTSYGMRGRDAYAYVALERGYFRAAGFDVSIEPGGDFAAGLRRLVNGGGPVFAALDLTACLLAAAAPALPSDIGPGDPAAAAAGTGRGKPGAGPVAPAAGQAGPGTAQGGPGAGPGGPGAGPGGPGAGSGGPGAGPGGPGAGPGGPGAGPSGPGAGPSGPGAGPGGPGGPGAAGGAGGPGGGNGGGGSGRIRVLAGIHQRTTAAILAPGGGKIGTPRDLRGKVLADLPGSTVRSLFPAYARLAGIDPARTAWVAATPQSVGKELAAGQVAGVGDTVVGRWAVEAATHGRTAVVLAYSDQLQDLYGDALVTSAAYAQAEPGSARKFAAALLRGLADAIDDPAAAGVIMHKYVPAVGAQAAAAEMALLAPYVRSSAEGLPVGALDANRVARGIALLQGAGQIGPGLTPDQVMTV